MVEEHELTEEELYLKAKEELEKDLMEQQESLKDLSTPKYTDKDTQYKFLREMLLTKDSTKIANLQSEEMGNLKHSVRGCLKIASLSETLGLDIYSEYYKKKAEILSKTSMARYVKGTNFLNLIFTEIRKHVSGTEVKPEVKKKIFGWGQKQ